MRAFVIALLLFSVLISAIVTNAIYINSVCNDISELAQELSHEPNREPLLSELKELWSKHLPIFNLSIRASELERMNDLVGSLEASCQAQNEEEFQKYCNLISELATEISHYEKLSLRSVF